MFRIVETTTDELIIAEKISKYIIKRKLSTCVQIVDGIKSYYIWEDKTVSCKEYTVKIKTVENHIGKISSIINEISNYDVPEIISYAFRIEDEKYENWFNQNI
jgi:periplasmic divalent cation tolerance protein